MLVLCPNHHADFDNGVVVVDPDTLEISHPYDRSVDGRTLMTDDDHNIDRVHLTYHEQELFSPTEQ